jgi:EmrB/QacA subfamily drug resistance transporter
MTHAALAAYDHPRQARSGPGGRRWVVALTSVSFFMVALDALVVITALPAIRAGLHASLATLDWAVNAYNLTFAAGIVGAAALGDRLGRRRVYIGGLLLFTAASAACALAPDAGSLIAARAIQGLGAATVTPLSLTLLTAAFPAARRGAIVGIWGGIAGLAVASGPLIGGAVVQGLDWHWIFWVNVPIGVAAAAASLVRLPAGRGPARGLDLPGMVLMAGGSAALAWGLVRAASTGWADRWVITGLVAGAAALAAFIAWERRAAQPMLPLRLLRIRAFAAASASGFLMNGAIFSAAFLCSQYFQLGLGYSPLATGLRFLPWTATPMIIAPLAGALADRIGTRPLMAAGLALQAGGLAWIALAASARTPYPQLIAPLIIAGIGISAAIPATASAALSAVPPGDLGTASGVQNTLQRFGGVFGIAIVSAVFAAAGHLGSAGGVTAGFRPALGVAAGLSLLGAVIALAFGARRRAAAVRDADLGATPAAESAQPAAAR